MVLFLDLSFVLVFTGDFLLVVSGGIFVVCESYFIISLRRCFLFSFYLF